MGMLGLFLFNVQEEFTHYFGDARYGGPHYLKYVSLVCRQIQSNHSRSTAYFDVVHAPLSQSQA